MAQSSSKITLWIVIFTIAILAGTWISISNPVADKALAQAPGNKPTSKPATPKNGGSASGNNNTPSLNNGPKSLPKATIQSIPVIQQRAPIKPRT